MKIFLVFLTTLITIATALLLDYGAKKYSIFTYASGFIIISVVGINFLKFILWGIIHEKYDLSDSYPTVAVFFPLIYLISIYKGDAIFQISKIIGITLILVGIFYMNKDPKGNFV